MQNPKREMVELLNDVRAVYSDLASRPIERHCTRQTECCHFKLTGRTPYLTRGEALLAAKALRAAGKTSLPDHRDGACPFLRDNRCLIYDSRPFGCRTHFCQAAGGPYERSAVLDLIRRLETIDYELGGDGPREICSAVTDAMEGLKGRRTSKR